MFDSMAQKTVQCGVVVCLIASLLACSTPLGSQHSSPSTEVATGDSNIGAFYRYSDALPQFAGTLLREEPLDEHQSLAAAAQNVRLLYTSTEGLFARQTVVVSGALFLPKGSAPKGGWPLLAWAHGTVGIADICAPSWNGRQQRDTTYLNYWLSEGYAIVASDYQGLGTPGTHPYLATRPSSYSTLDIVRAVQGADFPLSDAVVLFGQSQGAGAALATAGYAPDYAPELDVRAVVATGVPYFTAEGLAAIQETRPKDVVDPKLGYNFLALSMLGMIEPGFVLEDYVSEPVLPVARAGAYTCYAEFKTLIKREGISYNKAFKNSPAKRLEKAFKRMEYPNLALTIPAFVGVGGKDADTAPRMQKAFIKDACTAGTAVETHYYPAGTHGSIVNGSTPDSSIFVRAAFDGKQLPGNCDRLPF